MENVELKVNGRTFEGTFKEKPGSQATNSNQGATQSTNQASQEMTASGKSESSMISSGTATTGSSVKQYPYEVVAVKRDEDGNIEEFKLQDGTVLDYEGCLEYIHSGKINLIAQTNKAGGISIRSQADGAKENNLSNLPTF